MKTKLIIGLAVFAVSVTCCLAGESAESSEGGTRNTWRQRQLLRSLRRGLGMTGRGRPPSNRDIEQLAYLVSTLPGTPAEQKLLFTEFLAGEFLPVCAATAETAVAGLGLDPQKALDFINDCEFIFGTLVDGFWGETTTPASPV